MQKNKNKEMTYEEERARQQNYNTLKKLKGKISLTLLTPKL